MRAAAAAGGAIPKLCATDSLKAFGSCRVCLVEIEGQRGFPASCTTLVAPGMKVKTESERLQKLRQGVVELYMSDHPETDFAGERSELRQVAAKLGMTTTHALWQRRPDASRGLQGREQSLFQLRPQCLHRLLALRACLQ